ncbi:DUF3298 domain-containing protein [Hymenobacter sp. M29]|uniref:DUF3298 domain-containing protein n=1 Tax=Hymenobacter mellowenesis TaxID=3063995 RepID=A0ABT9ABB5_9BACT|nr:DUF3298 and DUF4163 domain-containing protein [Hymenobacter sp. M29]MDO7847135.1 DUF3298 domain-containing protein [Hymenobacter sp. M29]
MPLGLSLLAACHSDTKTTQTATTSDTPPVAADAASPALTDSPGAYYRQYRGLLPGTADTITLNLTVAPRRSDDTELAGAFGSYHGADGHPYELASKPTPAPDSVLLFDVSPEKADNQREGANWRLRRQGTELTGTYNGQPLQLREVQPDGSLPLVVRYYADSIVAFPGVAKSPAAHLSLQVLLPKAGSTPLAENIMRDLRGDTLPNLAVSQFPQFWAKQRADYQKSYRADAEEGRKSLRGASDDLPFGYGLNYEDQQSTYVLWNQGSLLSLGFYGYSFTGGAHGNYGTLAATYDTRTGQRLRFADIFRPNFEAQLSKLLDAAVRRTLRIPTTQPLEETLFVKTMPVTHNVYLTGGGAVFIYTPYEIASYAQGEIPVFVPMAELQPLLKLQPAS